MPLLSAFTPCGLLALESTPSEAQQIYDQLVASLGKPGENYSVVLGSREDAWCYATAKALAVAHLTLKHAGLQIDPSCVFEYMADREQEWGITPPPFATLQERRGALAAAMILPRGARREAVTAALAALLVSDFVFYRTTQPSEIVNWPELLGDSPMSLQLPTTPNKLYRLAQPVSFDLGSPQAVRYGVLPNATVQPPLLVGDVVVVDAADVGRAERVTVTAVSATPATDRRYPAYPAVGAFTATFTKPHDIGLPLTTAAWPTWASTQRQNLIVVSPAAAVDPTKRLQIGALLEKVLRGVSTWAIVAQTSGTSLGGTAGPFLVGTSPLGATPLGAVAFP